MQSVFEQVMTKEEYTPEYTQEELEKAEKEFFTVESEATTLSADLISAANNAMALDFIADTATDMTGESYETLVTSIQAISIANGVDKNAITGEVDFTSEADSTDEDKKKDEDGMVSKAKGFAKKLWAKVKALIAKAKLFVSKWVAKAMVVFVKGDEKRAKLAEDIKGKDLSKIAIPSSMLSKVFGKVVDSQKDQTSSSTARSLLTFSDKCDIGATDTTKLKELTGHEAPEGGTVDGIEKISGGRYLVMGGDKDGHTTMKVVSIKSDALSKYRKAKTLGEFDIKVDSVVEQLTTKKADIQKDIDNTAKSIEAVAKLSGIAGGDEVSILKETASSINAGIVGLRGILTLANDAVTVANIITKGDSAKEEKKEEKKEEEKKEEK